MCYSLVWCLCKLCTRMSTNEIGDDDRGNGGDYELPDSVKTTWYYPTFRVAGYSLGMAKRFRGSLDNSDSHHTHMDLVHRNTRTRRIQEQYSAICLTQVSGTRRHHRRGIAVGPLHRPTTARHLDTAPNDPGFRGQISSCRNQPGTSDQCIHLVRAPRSFSLQQVPEKRDRSSSFCRCHRLDIP